MLFDSLLVVLLPVSRSTSIMFWLVLVVFGHSIMCAKKQAHFVGQWPANGTGGPNGPGRRLRKLWLATVAWLMEPTKGGPTAVARDLVVTNGS